MRGCSIFWNFNGCFSKYLSKKLRRNFIFFSTYQFSSRWLLVWAPHLYWVSPEVFFYLRFYTSIFQLHGFRSERRNESTKKAKTRVPKSPLPLASILPLEQECPLYSLGRVPLFRQSRFYLFRLSSFDAMNQLSPCPCPKQNASN